MHSNSGTDRPDDATGAAMFAAILRAHATNSARPNASECPDEHVIAAFADGSISPERRAALLPHVAGCAACRSSIASIARTLADAEVSAAVGGARELRPRRSRWYGVTAFAAAAAIILVVWPRTAVDEAPIHRAPAVSALTPIPAAPVGAVARPTTLQWTAVAGADRYRVILFDAKGTVVYEQQLSDTLVALPDSVMLLAGRSYLWKVEARTGWDRWVGSPLVEFTVGGAGGGR